MSDLIEYLQSMQERASRAIGNALLCVACVPKPPVAEPLHPRQLASELENANGECLSEAIGLRRCADNEAIIEPTLPMAEQISASVSTPVGNAAVICGSGSEDLASFCNSGSMQLGLGPSELRILRYVRSLEAEVLASRDRQRKLEILATTKAYDLEHTQGEHSHRAQSSIAGEAGSVHAPLSASGSFLAGESARCSSSMEAVQAPDVRGRCANASTTEQTLPQASAECRHLSAVSLKPVGLDDGAAGGCNGDDKASRAEGSEWRSRRVGMVASSSTTLMELNGRNGGDKNCRSNDAIVSSSTALVEPNSRKMSHADWYADVGVSTRKKSLIDWYVDGGQNEDCVEPTISAAEFFQLASFTSHAKKKGGVVATDSSSESEAEPTVSSEAKSAI